MATRVRGRIAEEQAALRRVATLVAGGAAPDEVFATVATEAGRLLKVDFVVLVRYDPDDAITIVSTWARSGGAAPDQVGSRFRLGGHNVSTLVCRTGRPARIDHEQASGAIGDVAVHRWRLRSWVGVPISVEGGVWGAVIVASAGEDLLPGDTEARLAEFTDLVATALANAQARVELRAFAEEQAALRRVATLVARAAPPEEVLAAVAAEECRLLGTDLTVISRYDSGGMVTVVGSWSDTGRDMPFPPGTRVPLGGRNVITRVFETGRLARIDDYGEAHGGPAEAASGWGVRSAIGAPITIEGRLWGVITMGFTAEKPLPAGAEARLDAFTELAATAIANAQARVELRAFAEEQAALRRVATLVARAAPPEEVFAAVAAEVGQLLGADLTFVGRFDPDAQVTVHGEWSRAGELPFPIGTRVPLGGRNPPTLVFETGRPARLDDYADASGGVTAIVRDWGARSSLAVPIRVEGRLWGMVSLAYLHAEPLSPENSEARLTGFTELVATAIANAEAQAALTASRARIVAAADATRRRIERDLHDGAQQRLVTLALHVRGPVRAAVPPGAEELIAQLDGVAAEITEMLEELRRLARGIHPVALAGGGLGPALKTLARRSAVPVRLDVRVDRRLPEPVELAAYYAVAEALTNAAKYAHATVVDVTVDADEGWLHVLVCDDGRGGADPTDGSGLVGLADRIEALGGRFSLDSRSGVGTTVALALPLDDDWTPEPPRADAWSPPETGQGADPERSGSLRDA